MYYQDLEDLKFLKVLQINFSKLSPKFKNIVGFGLIFLVFICVIMGLRWIQNIRGQNDNKKKKNKKEKKKQKWVNIDI